MGEEVQLDAYLKRINHAGSIAPTLQTLEMLTRLHPAAIAFETLDPMMELPVRLGLRDIEHKLIVERRGGYCFEHNLLFKAALESMDYVVTPLAASVLWGEPDGYEPQLPTHMALAVEVAGVSYLVDVGFGGQTPTAPLRLKADLEQETPNERFRLLGGHPQWRLEAEIAGEWRPLYQFTLAPQSLEDYVTMNDTTMALFRNGLRASRVEPGKRTTLLNTRLHMHEAAGTTTRELTSVAELREVLTTTFGIQLPQTDRLDPALETVLATGTGG
ncbi:MAG: arylamine N-acetyltransferase [Devosia sp.]